MLKIKTKAPDFKLPDQDGQTHSLSEFKGRWVLMYFYPKDDTPGCIKEACTIRDSFPSFEKLKAVVLGISTDSIKSHRKFADKYKLPFTLLADEEKKVIKLYGVWAKKIGTLRTSFLIDPKGKVIKIYKNVKPEIHAEKVLKDLKSLV